MQATLNIDDKLFEEAAKLAATENQSQLIEIALSEFIKNHQQAQSVMCVIWSAKLKSLLIMTIRKCVQANNELLSCRYFRLD